MYIDDYLGRNFNVGQIIRDVFLPLLTNSIRTFQLGLTNGGPAGLIYGFIFAWFGTTLQALVMGEMASAFVLPTY